MDAGSGKDRKQNPRQTEHTEHVVRKIEVLEVPHRELVYVLTDEYQPRSIPPRIVAPKHGVSPNPGESSGRKNGERGVG